MYKAVGGAFTAALVFAGVAFAADEPPKVRTMAGRHQQTGTTEVSGWFSVTLFVDGSFDASFYLGSLDCDFIDFRAKHEARFIEWSIANPLDPVIVTFRTAGEFVFDPTTVVLDAPLWIHPYSGAVRDQGLFRRCGVDDTVVAFRLTIRSANFAPLGRYDGDISATLLSGATIQRSFSGTFSAVSPMPFRPITGFLMDRVSVEAGGCFGLRWHALPGAVGYGLEYVGPNRRFGVQPFSRTPEANRGSAWGAVMLPAVTVATLCVTSDTVPTGMYELRLFGLDGAGSIVSGTGSSQSFAFYLLNRP